MKGRMHIGIAMVVVIVAVVVIAVMALAQQERPAPPPAMAPGGMGGQGMMGPGMMGPGMGPGMMRGGPCPIAGAMGAMMARSSMVVAGKYIYVMAGNTIMKYDENLRLVKQAEMKMDTAKMQKMMLQHMRSCPACQGMMPGWSMGGMRRGMGGRAPTPPAPAPAPAPQE